MKGKSGCGTDVRGGNGSGHGGFGTLELLHILRATVRGVDLTVLVHLEDRRTSRSWKAIGCGAQKDLR